jgi:hypothetical protein
MGRMSPKRAHTGAVHNRLPGTLVTNARTDLPPFFRITRPFTGALKADFAPSTSLRALSIRPYTAFSVSGLGGRHRSGAPEVLALLRQGEAPPRDRPPPQGRGRWRRDDHRGVPPAPLRDLWKGLRRVPAPHAPHRLLHRRDHPLPPLGLC